MRNSRSRGAAGPAGMPPQQARRDALVLSRASAFPGLGSFSTCVTAVTRSSSEMNCWKSQQVSQGQVHPAAMYNDLPRRTLLPGAAETCGMQRGSLCGCHIS